MERWIRAHRIGITAYLAQGLGGAIADQTDMLDLRQVLRGLLKKYLIDEVKGGAADRKWILRGLPPSMLHLLEQAIREYSKLRRGELKPLEGEVPRASRWLTEDRGEQCYTPLGFAQSWAHHMLFGSGSARRLAELGAMLTKNEKEGETEDEAKWRRVSDDEKAIAEITVAAETLRYARSNTKERCEAIGQLTRLLGRTPYWAQVENVLLQHQFFWPLLVLREEGGRFIAASLPVAVDVVFDAKGEVRFAREEAIFPSSAAVLSSEWKGMLKKCVEVGKELWQSEHWHKADPVGDLVEGASVVFDFSVADRITSDITEIGNYGVKAVDRSAEAYFVQAVLSRMMGGSPTVASAVTGLIGRRHETRRDYYFDTPGGVEAKLAFAFASRAFERIVLPNGAWKQFGRYKRANGHQQTAETVFPATLKTVTDIVQVGGWRRHRYVRCPDVQWHAHGPDADMRRKQPHPDAQRIIAAIAANQSSPVLRLPGESPLAVLSALAEIDSHFWGRQVRYRLPIKWAFVRAVPWELDGRFWHTIWETVGASQESFREFFERPRRDEAVKRIEKLLNRFRPAPESPAHMAPDLLVIVDAQHLELASEVTNPLSRPYIVSPLFDEIERRGRLQRYSPVHEPYLGHTRVILLSEVEGSESEVAALAQDDLAPQLRAIVEELEEDTQKYALLARTSRVEELFTKIVRSLAVFRYGFTQQAAALVIINVWEEEPKPTGYEIRHEILDPLENHDILRRVNGMYHVPDRVRAMMKLDEAGGLDRAKLHVTAGAAIAPYITAAEYPSLAADTAFRPQFVHEARSHFDTALVLIRDLKNDLEGVVPEELERIEKVVVKAIKGMIHFAEPPTWGQVDKLVNSVKDPETALTMALELLEWDKACEVQIHPEHYLWTARAAARAAYSDRRNSKRANTRRQLALDYFHLALAACTRFPSEETENTAHVLSFFAAFLLTQMPKEIERAITYSEQVVRLLKQGAPDFIIDGTWFDRYADLLTDHAEAAEWYERGRQVHTKMGQLWLKALGAASLGDRQDILDAVLESLTASSCRLRIVSQASSDHVKKRLARGEQILSQLGVDARTFVTGGPYYVERSREILERGGDCAEEAAIAMLERGAKSAPKSHEIYIELIRLLSKRGSGEEVDQVIKRWVEQVPNDSMTYKLLGRFYEQQNRDEEAKQAYRTGIDRAPGDGSIYTILGQLYERQQKWVEAEQAYR